jgi:hypothetical protein
MVDERVPAKSSYTEVQQHDRTKNDLVKIAAAQGGLNASTMCLRVENTMRPTRKVEETDSGVRLPSPKRRL